MSPSRELMGGANQQAEPVNSPWSLSPEHDFNNESCVGGDVALT